MGAMTNTNPTIQSSYHKAHPVLADLKLARKLLDGGMAAWQVANEMNGYLHLTARGLAPRMAETVAESGPDLMPEYMPKGPRQMRAYLMGCEAYTWNLLCDRESEAQAAELFRLLLAGQDVRIAWDHNTGKVLVNGSDAPEAPTSVPVVGQPYVVDGVETIIPTYVAPCLAPAANGACLTDNLPEGAQPTGWYVEFHYPAQRPGVGQHRRYIAFPAPAARTPRHTHTDVEGNRYETYATSELRPGDVVLNSGMLILLVDHAPVAHHLPGVFAAHGYVLNAADETVRNLVGGLLFTWDDHYSCHAARWTVQGNDLATWQVLSSGPRLTALHIAPAIEAAEREARCGTAAADIPHYLCLGARSLELSLAATALATGADVSRLPRGVLRRREDASSYSASAFLAGIEAYRKAHLNA